MVLWTYLSAPKTKMMTTNNQERSGCPEVTHALLIRSTQIKRNRVNGGVCRGAWDLTDLGGGVQK